MKAFIEAVSYINLEISYRWVCFGKEGREIRQIILENYPCLF